MAEEQMIYGKATVTLVNGHELTFEEDALLSDGIKLDSATSGDSSFDLGAAVIGQCTLKIDNAEGYYDQFDFDQAKVIPYVGIGIEGSDVPIVYQKKGAFTVDDASGTGAVLNLTCLDNLAKFDRPYYESTLTFPATLLEMVVDACEVCGVTYDGKDFANSDYVVQIRPTDDALTFRAILSYIAQLACSYVRCDVDGKIGFAWYDRSAILDTIDGGIFDVYDEALYQTGDALDCGNFFNYGEPNHDAGTFTDTGAYHHIYDLSSQDINTSDVEVTGLQVSGVEKENKSYFNTTQFYNGLYSTIQEKIIKSLNSLVFTLPIGTVTDQQCFFESSIGRILSARQSYRLDFDITGVPEPIDSGSGGIFTTPVNTMRVYADGIGSEEIVGETELTEDGHYSVDFELTSDHAGSDGKASLWIDFWLSNRVGKRVTLSNFSIQKTEEEEVVRSALYGSAGYVLSIADNPLVTAATVESIAQNIGPKVAGLRFRPLSISAVADPNIQAGDIAIVEDRLGRSYQTILTNLSFTIGAFESLSCGAETTGENSSTRFTEDSKTGVLVTEDTKKLLTEYDTQVQRFFHLMVGIFGLFRTQEGNVEYIHEKLSLADSTYIWRISKEGFMVSQDGGSTYVNAIDESGNAVLNAFDVIQK